MLEKSMPVDKCVLYVIRQVYRTAFRLEMVADNRRSRRFSCLGQSGTIVKMPKKGGTRKMDHIESMVIQCTYPHSFGARLVEIAGGLCMPDPEDCLTVIWTNKLSQIKIAPGAAANPNALVLKVRNLEEVEHSITNVPVGRTFRRSTSGETIIDEITLEIGSTNYRIRLEQV